MRIRVVCWNIRAGGGKRLPQICAALRRWRPDVLALSEFRGTAASSELADWLASRGLSFQRTTASQREPARNGLLVASRYPLRPPPVPVPAPRDAGDRMLWDARWLHVRLVLPENPDLDLELAAVHVPNRVSGRKFPFLDRVARFAASTSKRPVPALIAGDTNSGRQGLDEARPVFDRREHGWFERLETAGWSDAFRTRNPTGRAYTWYSPNGDNGFRLDQMFLSPPLAPALTDIRHRWAGGARRAGVSDHAALVAALTLPGK